MGAKKMKVEKHDAKSSLHLGTRSPEPGTRLIEPVSDSAIQLFNELFRGREELVYKDLTTRSHQNPIGRSGPADDEMVSKFRQKEGSKYNLYRVSASYSILPASQD